MTTIIAAESQGAAAGGKSVIEKQINLTPKKDYDNQSYKKRELKLVMGRQHDREGNIAETFALQKDSKATFSNGVQLFIESQMPDGKFADKATLESWQVDFFAQVQKMPGWDPHDVGGFADKFVGTEAGLAAAVKISEWMQATYQSATGAYLDEVQFYNGKYTSEIMTAGTAQSELGKKGKNVLARLVSWTSRGVKSPQWGVGETKVEKEAKSDLKKAEKRPVNEKDTNYTARTIFPDADKKVTDKGLKYDSAKLTLAQKAFLLRTGITLDVLIPDTQDLAEKNEIAHAVVDIAKARVDFYQALGKSRINNLNLIVGKTDSTSLNIADIDTPFLSVERRTQRIDAALVAAGADVADSFSTLVEKEIVVASKDIADETKKQIAEKVKLDNKNLAKNQITAELTRLEAPDPVPTEEQLKQKALAQKEIDKIAEQNAQIDEAANILENHPTLLKAVAEAEAKIPLIQLTKLQKYLAPNKSDGSPEAGSRGEKVKSNEIIESEKAAKDQAVVRAEQALSTAQAANDRILAAISGGGNNKGQVPSALTDALTKAQAEIVSKSSELANAQKTAAKTAADLAKASKELAVINTLIAEYKDQWAAIQTATEQRDNAEAKFAKITAEQEVIHKATKMKGTAEPKTVGTSEITAAEIATKKAANEAEIKTKTKAQEQIEHPNKDEKEHKKVVYGELVALVGDVDNVEKRALEHEVAKPDLKIDARLYGEYPPVYLRTLQVMFGNDITNVDKQKEFQRATTLLSPELFLEIYRDTGGDRSIISVYDRNLLDPDLIKTLSQEQLTKMYGELIDKGAANSLGEKSKRDKNMQAAAEGSTPSVAPLLPDTITDIQKKIYHYSSIEELTQRILESAVPTVHGAYLGIVNIYLPGARTHANLDLVFSQAKAYAIEIDKRRKALI